MQDLALFAIASQKSRWLAAKASVVSDNIANADTPGYRARDVAAFEAALQESGFQPVRTAPAHFQPFEGQGGPFERNPRSPEVVKHSGNTVSLETELMRLGEVRAQHSMVTGVISAFNRMLLSSSKG